MTTETTDKPQHLSRRSPGARFALLALLLAPAIVRADAVPQPPSSCPGGAMPTSGHCGQQCLPKYCTADADCSGGKTCRQLPLCIKTLTCRSNWAIDGGVFTSDTVVATCGNGHDCATDAPCKMVRVCAGPEVIITGCTVSDRAGPASVFAIILLGLVAVTLVDRIWRKRRAP